MGKIILDEKDVNHSFYTVCTQLITFATHQNLNIVLPEGLREKAKKKRKVFRKTLERANRKEVLKQLPDWHEAAFEEIDCLDCAACCKNFSPRFKPPDIRRISKSLRMKEGEFIDRFLIVDDDGDHVVNSKPCPFLAADNTCEIYDDRPSDCSRFPYTDEDVFLDKKSISLKNSTFCPAAFAILERMEKFTL